MNTALTLALAAAGLSCAAAVAAWGTVALTIWWEMRCHRIHDSPAPILPATSPRSP
ncbi:MULTISPECIES: hypothetical protein [Nocardia]|uniref:hypothetical protein n=1 Tax=Nocardia TaxID=1817 RepID=UPI001894242E|nr:MULTISPECIES: hypothetical protein [Nocardia]MBF6349730.1 hypothetical protein [Nocardia flavorosea]